MAMAAITLTTDFGLRDWFVGTLKGVILRIAPRARVIDISHEIPAGDIPAAAFALAAAYRFFPRGTVHVAIVDPGVGSARAAIAVRTTNYFFVGPDNGVLSLALAGEEVKRIHRLENDKYFLHPVSCTFHGRDVFAPVAAHLSRGVRIGNLGPRLQDYQRLVQAPVQEESRGWKGSIVYIDRFGNAITNLARELPVFAGRWQERKLTVQLANRRRKSRLPIVEFYQAVSPGEPLALFGSTGFLELAVNAGSAAALLDLAVGDTVFVRNV